VAWGNGVRLGIRPDFRLGIRLDVRLDFRLDLRLHDRTFGVAARRQTRPVKIHPMNQPTARIATAADLDAVVSTLTTAFSDDPLWGPVFPDLVQAAALWRLCAASASRYPWTFVTGAAESVAVWIPPGGTELTAEEEAGFDEFLTGVAGRAVTDEVTRIFDLFGSARPAEPHFYLSVLATHDDHRGKGLGIGLLAENLARIDEVGGAAYLESSNPVANDARYEKLGFVVHDRITAPSGHVMTTMWRPARGENS
jgi:GNAT superfamily N-acetyltransferase